MATRIASQILAVGSVADATAWTPTPERTAVTFTAVEVTATSVVRCLVKDPSRVLASTILNGSSTKKLSIENIETPVTIHMEQLQGSAQVTAADGTGGDVTANEIETGAVGAAEIAALAVDTGDIANDAITQAKIDAAAVDTTELAAGAATLPKFDHTGIKVIAGVGSNGAGACTVTGAVIGDRVMAVFGAPTAGGAMVGTAAADFEAAVTVNDQVQQVNVANWSANTYVFILIPAQA